MTSYEERRALTDLSLKAHSAYWSKVDPREVTKEKVCKKCEVLLPSALFRVTRRNFDGLMGACRACLDADDKVNKRRRYGAAVQRLSVLKTLGLTTQDRDDLWAAQGGLCAICSKTLSERGNRGCHLDHNHETGHIRGLLCGGCNTSIGALGDNVEGLARALAYVSELNPNETLRGINARLGDVRARVAAPKHNRRARADLLDRMAGLPPGEHTPKAIAGLLGICRSTITHWRDAGLPVVVLSRRDEPGRRPYMDYMLDARTLRDWYGQRDRASIRHGRYRPPAPPSINAITATAIPSPTAPPPPPWP